MGRSDEPVAEDEPETPMTTTAPRSAESPAVAPGIDGLLDWAVNYRADEAGEAAAQVRYLLLDHAANALGGLTAESTRLVRRYAAGRTGGVPAPGGHSLLEEYAAFVAGVSAHALESDDTHQASSSHPGSAVFPAVLALATAEGASFEDAVAASVVGYEVMTRIGMAATVQGQYDRGFHPTGTTGVFGAAAAASWLLGLDAASMRSALGISLSLAAGSMAFLVDGAWTKRLHPGWAAHGGLIAARLAAAGFEGPRDAICGPDGYLHSYSDTPLDAGAEERLTAGLGVAPLAIHRTSIKAHACCRYKQAPIDAVLGLVAEHDIAPEQIARIRVGVLEAGWNIIAAPEEDKRRPVSVVDAQFSMPYGAAVAVLHRSAGTRQYEPAVIASPEVAALMDRVECYRSDDLDAVFPERWPAEVVIELRDGGSVSRRVDYPKGDPENPLTLLELQAKFRDLTVGVVTASGQAQVIEAAATLGQGVTPSGFTTLIGSGEVLEADAAEIG